MRAKAAEDLADEGDAAGAAIVQARNKFLTQVKHELPKAPKQESVDTTKFIKSLTSLLSESY